MSRKTGRHIIRLLLLFMVHGTLVLKAHAQNVTFTANAPGKVGTGERFTVTYQLNAEPERFAIPDFNKFRQLGSSSSSMDINGQVTYTVHITLICYEPGKYTIDGASARVNGKTVESNAVTIEVSGSASGGSSQQKSVPENSKVSSSGENIFIRLVLDKKNVYVGEQITGWVKVYTKVGLEDYERTFELPPFTGFYKKEIETPRVLSQKREKIGSNVYTSGVLRRIVLYPQKTGEIIIPEFTMDVAVQKQYGRTARTHNEWIRQMMNPTEVLTLKSKAVKVKVKPVPNTPENYSGAVGKFDLTSSVSRTNLQTNDALNYKITVSGSGNVKLLEEPDINFPATFEVFDPVINTSLNESDLYRSGKKTFEYTLIPRHAGDFDIPSFSYVYFDPSSKKYITKRTEAYKIKVLKGDGDTTSGTVVVNALPQKEDIELLESDIHYIQRKTKLVQEKPHFPDTRYIYLFYLIPFCLFLVSIILQRRRIKQNSDIARVKNRKANKLARKRLKTAKRMMAEKKQGEFFEETIKAIWGYLSDKLFIPVSDLSKERAINAITGKKGIDPQLTHELSEIIDLCEFARYAPAGESDNMKDVYKRTEKMISKLDQKL